MNHWKTLAKITKKYSSKNSRSIKRGERERERERGRERERERERCMKAKFDIPGIARRYPRSNMMQNYSLV